MRHLHARSGGVLDGGARRRGTCRCDPCAARRDTDAQRLRRPRCLATPDRIGADQVHSGSRSARRAIRQYGRPPRPLRVWSRAGLWYPDGYQSTFTWPGSDDRSGIARFEISHSTDGGSWTIVSPSATSASLDRGLAPGHTRIAASIENRRTRVGERQRDRLRRRSYLLGRLLGRQVALCLGEQLIPDQELSDSRGSQQGRV